METLVQLTAPACVCRLHTVAVRQAALVSDESALEACACSRRCAIQIDDLYLLGLGSWIVLAFLKKLCDNNEHQELAYNIDGKFQVPASKEKICQLVIRDSQAAF